MITRAGLIGLAACVLSLTSGCVIQRNITDIVAHKDYNNYKIQTISTHWALLWVWPTSEVWTCQKKGEGFKCHVVDHDGSLKGFDNGGSKAAPAAEAPAADAAPAADEGDKK
ncbi:MAG TPA: hypothetical protein VEQ58_20700 [Polyangiaceae bacterium]|nr:hypothetical protein [Polyangiaceae bacterium]